MEWQAGNGGWVQIEDNGQPGCLYVRLAPNERGRLTVREVYLDGRGEQIVGANLRTLPLHAIEAEANVDNRLKSRLGLPGVDLSRLASHFGTTFGARAGHWVADSLRAQVKASGVPQAPLARHRRTRANGERPHIRAPSEGLTDEFLGTLAVAYAALVREGGHPARTLAAEAGVPVRTVHRWIYEARKRGALPPGTRGRAG